MIRPLSTSTWRPKTFKKLLTLALKLNVCLVPLGFPQCTGTTYHSMCVSISMAVIWMLTCSLVFFVTKQKHLKSITYLIGTLLTNDQPLGLARQSLHTTNQLIMTRITKPEIVFSESWRVKECVYSSWLHRRLECWPVQWVDHQDFMDNLETHSTAE